MTEGFVDERMNYFRKSDNQSKSSIVLIDDCPAFCNIMKAVAEDMDISLSCFNSLAEMYSLAHFSNYDLALIDYHLESWCGLEIARYIDIFFQDLPVVLISGDNLRKDSSWPSSIRTTLNKEVGPRAILESSLSTLEKYNFYQFMERGAYSEVNSEPAKKEFYQ